MCFFREYQVVETTVHQRIEWLGEADHKGVKGMLARAIQATKEAFPGMPESVENKKEKEKVAMDGSMGQPVEDGNDGDIEEEEEEVTEAEEDVDIVMAPKNQ